MAIPTDPDVTDEEWRLIGQFLTAAIRLEQCVGAVVAVCSCPEDPQRYYDERIRQLTLGARVTRLEPLLDEHEAPRLRRLRRVVEVRNRVVHDVMRQSVRFVDLDPPRVVYDSELDDEVLIDVEWVTERRIAVGDRLYPVTALAPFTDEIHVHVRDLHDQYLVPARRRDQTRGTGLTS